MDSSTCKLYHVDGFDSRQFLETYMSDKPEMIFGEETLIFPIGNLTKTFSAFAGSLLFRLLMMTIFVVLLGRPERFFVLFVPVSLRRANEYVTVLLGIFNLCNFLMGYIKGEIMIDLSAGPMIHHLYAACGFFKHIVVLKTSDRCIMELKRWLDTRTGAFHWGHATQLHVDTEGSRDQVQDKEEQMRSAIQHVMKCDFEKENIIETMDLPPADCIISAWFLDTISKDHDDYKRCLRKFSKLLRPGGHLILIGSIDATYFSVGKDKFHLLRYDDDFARKALVGEGFVIDCCKVKETKVVSDICDYKGVIFIAAHKEK